MTVLEIVGALAAVIVLAVAFCGLAGFSPKRLWHRAKGVGPYAGAWRDGLPDRYDSDLGNDGGGGPTGES